MVDVFDGTAKEKLQQYAARIESLEADKEEIAGQIREVLKDAAIRLMFDMSDEQYETLEKEFEIIIKQMNLIGEIDGVDEVEPMTFPFNVTTDYLREDVAETPLTKEEVLANAKDVLDGQIKLPKVVG